MDLSQVDFSNYWTVLTYAAVGIALAATAGMRAFLPLLVLGLAARLGRNLAVHGREVALRLEPLERGVDGAHRDIAPGGLFDEALDRHRIGPVAQGPHGQQGQLLELAQAVALHGQRL